MNYPVAIAGNSDGSLLVVDRENNAIRILYSTCFSRSPTHSPVSTNPTRSPMTNRPTGKPTAAVCPGTPVHICSNNCNFWAQQGKDFLYAGYRFIYDYTSSSRYLDISLTDITVTLNGKCWYGQSDSITLQLPDYSASVQGNVYYPTSDKYAAIGYQSGAVPVPNICAYGWFEVKDAVLEATYKSSSTDKVSISFHYGDNYGTDWSGSTDYQNGCYNTRRALRQAFVVE